MKKYFIILILITLIVWPPPQTKSEKVTAKTIVETMINYEIVKYQVLDYQINKKIQSISNKIDSLKLKRK